eukprot:PhF_6_TR19051/c1_g2_i4/m.27997
MFHQKEVVQYLVTLPGCNLNASGATYTCAVYRRYPMLLCLFGLGADVNYISEGEEGSGGGVGAGDAILHFLCRQSKPHAPTIRELCKLRRLHVNALNHEGLNALHLVCTFATGVEGREVVNVLVKRGIPFDSPTPQGLVPAQLTTNPFVREALSLYHFRKRTVPRLTPDLEHKYDSLEITKLPATVTPTPTSGVGGSSTTMKAATPEPMLNTSSSSTAAKLTQESEKQLVARLFQESLSKRKAWKDEQLKQIEKSSEGTQLSKDVIEEACERMHRGALDHKKQIMDEAFAKHLPEISVSKTLPTQEVQEACQRLCFTSVANTKQTQEKL